MRTHKHTPKGAQEHQQVLDQQVLYRWSISCPVSMQSSVHGRISPLKAQLGLPQDCTIHG